MIKYYSIAITFFLSFSLYGQDLQILTPNGGEEFQAGTEVLITWEGISETDTVSIEFSSDNGDTWEALTEDATGNEYNWNVPQLQSDECLIRITQIVDTSYKEGDILWEKSYGGSYRDEAKSICQTLDGNYIVAGGSYSSDDDVSGNKGSGDYWILKLKENGELEWEKSFGGKEDEAAYSVQQALDGGYIVAGWSRSTDGDITNPKDITDYWILKLKENGELEWEKSYGGSDSDYAYSIQPTSDGGSIVAGGSSSSDGNISENKGNYDYWILKLKENGDLEWEKSYGGSESDRALSIQQTLDGGYVVVGYSYSSDGDVSNSKGPQDYWILKLKENGDLEWEKSFGGSKYDKASSILQTQDGGYIVAGSISSSDVDVSENKGKYDYWILKLTDNGEIEWEKSYGGSTYDYANSIQQTLDGGYIVAGWSKSSDGDISNSKGEEDYWILKLNSNGDLDWERSYGGGNREELNSIQQTLNGDYVVAGYSNSSGGDVSENKLSWAYWIVKIAGANIPQSDTSDSPFSIINEEDDPDTSYSFDFYISPNATSDEATINLELQEEMEIEIVMYDNLGRKMIEIFNGTAPEGIRIFEVDMSSFSSARYYIRLITPEQTMTKIIELLN